MIDSSLVQDSTRHKVLLVDDAAVLLKALAQSLGEHFDVTTAASAEQALAALERDGPFAVVISDYEMPGMEGTELLAQVHQRWPETSRIMLTGVVDIDVTIGALNSGRILRFLEKPCPKPVLLAAVEECVDEHRRRVLARVHEGEMQFSHDALWDFNAALTSRITEQTRALRKLNHFVCELNNAESLGQVAKMAADAACGMLQQRAVEVRLGSTLADLTTCALAGGAMSSERHVEEIVAADGSVGMLVIDMRDADKRPLRAAQREILGAISSVTAVATYNFLRRLERDEAQHAAILALARLAEHRDDETGKHLERVSLFCRLIAEGLREDGQHRDVITKDWILDLVRSAPLHDIGKVGIPDAILLKPSTLTPDEWVVMKRHPDIGAQTLRAVMSENKKQSFLQMSLDIVWCHHEKWDGSGYPRGLAGDAIPLSARILATADVYDALTTQRPYKPTWEHERAIEWIRQSSGTHFDPAVAEAFLARAEQVDFIRARLADTADDVIGTQRVFGMAS